MQRLVAQNIKRLREHLASNVDPKTRVHLMKVLVEEEDKLGADFELLSDLDQHVRTGQERIARQAALVATMERDGHDGLGEAKALLDGLIDSQDLHETYRQRVLIRIQKNKVQPR